MFEIALIVGVYLVIRSRLFWLLVLVGLIAAAMPAKAQGMPSYDVNDKCRSLAGGNYSFEAACRHSESKARETVQHQNVDSDVWRNCVRLSGSNGNYAFLQACIRSESGAKRALGYSAERETVVIRGGGGGDQPAEARKDNFCGDGYRLTRDGCEPR
jgi:hypothetical protein